MGVFPSVPGDGALKQLGGYKLPLYLFQLVILCMVGL